ncbi:MAG: malate dehydrogenase [Candidatus Bathyarchaeota archaeon]|nr:malate dehydrogenase [Candidatus Bathyarchaeota archaeon]
MSKATVIGVGSLGSCIAYEIANRGLVDELVLVDICRELAEGNAADISQALAFRSNVKVTDGSYGEAEDSDIVVVTAGKPRTPDMESRMELLEANKKIISTVASNLKKMSGNPVIVTLTNPVDVMNYVMWKSTGLERGRALGSAGMLDSARFRTVLSRRCRAPILDVEAYVIGEHGENQVPVFSKVKVRGKMTTFSMRERTGIAHELRQSALDVISKKGATIFAPANNTANLVESILKNSKETAVCSAVLDGEYGLGKVSIGVPVTLGLNGIERIVQWELDEEERRSFYRGADYLSKTVRELLQPQTS